MRLIWNDLSIFFLRLYPIYQSLPGDSEVIRITAKYDAGSGRWIFMQAFLSAHFG